MKTNFQANEILTAADLNSNFTECATTTALAGKADISTGGILTPPSSAPGLTLQSYSTNPISSIDLSEDGECITINTTTINGSAVLSGNATLDNTNKLATSKVIKTAVDGKQATLVSGTNIKTINNTSILGSGNITIGEGVTIDDTTTSSTKVWSSSKVSNSLTNKVDSSVQLETATGSNKFNTSTMLNGKVYAINNSTHNQLFNIINSGTDILSTSVRTKDDMIMFLRRYSVELPDSSTVAIIEFVGSVPFSE